MADFDDRTVLITGPAKGMGARITRRFAEEGADLVLAGRDTDAIAPVAEEARAMGRDAIVAPCDVTDAGAVEAAVEAGIEAYGKIDVLVNVAGGTGPLGASSWETEPDDFDQIVELNMKGAWLTMRAVIPHMIERRYGKIVNVGGTFGLRGRQGRMAYSASKWGLRGITKSTALEAGPHNINVNCVCPGMVDGPRFQQGLRGTRRAARHHGGRGAAGSTRTNTRSSGSRPIRTSPKRCSFLPATAPVTSPARISPWTAAG